MKLTHYIPAILLVVCFGACKKKGIDNPSQYSKIYMPQAIDYPAVRSLIMADTTQYIIFGAAYGGVADQSALINVQFAVNPDLVDSFNRKNGTSFAPLPDGSYQLETLQTEIPSGKVSSTPLRLAVKTVGGLEPSKDYLLPISIQQTDAGIPVNEGLRTAYFQIRGEFQEYNRSTWILLEASSMEAPNIAANAFDNNLSTTWHTQWKSAKPAHPHYLKVDMNGTFNVHGFYFVPSNNLATGNPQKVHAELSLDGNSWTNTGTFTFPNVYSKQTFYLHTPVQAKYFRFVVDSSFANTHFTHLLEVGAF
ncbi:BT_3987 domain-containing protein [Longitalea luteola]|uniref:BT_3987 domain-containing protein n=1 Tax=Longitalea luteola TaxID=2812563 RepID=UPI001A964C6E|nr:DUF1735 domain-containing protein [Longitalea luteola]